MTIIEQPELSPQLAQYSAPNYALSPEESSFIIKSTFADVQDSLRPDATNILISGPTAALSNVVRTIEAFALPTIPEVMADYEDTSRFMVILQDGATCAAPEPAVPAHVFRINMLEAGDTTSKPTGLPTFDDVLKMGLATEEQLLDFYQVTSLRELGTRYVNVESNIAVEGASMRKPYSALGYRAIFEIIQQEQKRGAVAYQNPEAMASLSHLAQRSLPLLGNPELNITNDDKGKAGDKYFPLTIEVSPWSVVDETMSSHNSRMFTDAAYAKTHSRMAGLVASRQLELIIL